MGSKITADRARTLVLEQSDVDLSTLGDALDREGPDLAPGVPSRLVVDMLHVGETETWERIARRTTLAAEPYRPFCVVPKDDGKSYRSWLPEDLSETEESHVRAFAQSSKNELVRARVFEILWTRFKSFPDADAAITSRLASVPLYHPDDHWPALVKNLGRLTMLVLSVNAQKHLSALLLALDDAAEKLDRSSRPFSFPVLADMVCNTLLTKKQLRAAFGKDRRDRWASSLEAIAARFNGDPHHGHDALMVLQGWHGRWEDSAAMKAVQRRVVEHLRDTATKSDAMVASSLSERALQAALDFGIPDLVESMRGSLMASIKSSIPTFSRRTHSFSLPPELIAVIDEILSGSASAAEAIRQLSLLPGLLEVDLAGLRTSSVDLLKDRPFLGLVPKVHYHQDGKVTFRATDFDGSVEQQVASFISVHLAFVEATLNYALVRLQPTLSPQTLLDALNQWPHAPTHRIQVLSVASERFANLDFVSAGFILFQTYEAVLRDLLRAGGYSALKVEPGGVQMDETLNSLLRSPRTRSVLGDPHCDLVEHVTCDPALGWNLRNEIAHGSIRPESLTAARVFLMWLILVRTTCFVARSSEGKMPDVPSTE
jgi:hypothetical protein